MLEKPVVFDILSIAEVFPLRRYQKRCNSKQNERQRGIKNIVSHFWESSSCSGGDNKEHGHF